MRIRMLLVTLIRMRIRIQVPKMIRIHADPDPQHWILLHTFHHKTNVVEQVQYRHDVSSTRTCITKISISAVQ
jgi:hypothetical protein